MKTVLITGANSGIGKALTIKYALEGYRVILACRNLPTANKTIEEIRKNQPAAHLACVDVDLGSFASVSRCVATLNKKHIRIDGLLLNAGIHIPYKNILTQDHCELQYQTNFLSGLLLTLLILTSESGRSLTQLVYTGSNAHKIGTLPFPSLFGFWYLYAVSKLDGTAAFFLLQKLVPTLDILIISPGGVQSNIHRYKLPILKVISKFIGKKTTAQATADYFYKIYNSKSRNEKYWYLGKSARPHTLCLDKEYQIGVWNRALAVFAPYLPSNNFLPLQQIRNFVGNFCAISYKTSFPRSPSDICNIVIKARSLGHKVHVVGKTHSYNDVFFCNQHIISLDNFKKLSLDPIRQRLNCGAGVTINEIAAYLDKKGFTLPFAGSFGGQTMVGAFSTSTHGFSKHGGVLGELVYQVTIVDGLGNIKIITDERELSAFRCSLGALGIIIEFELEVHKKDLAQYHVRSLDKKQLYTSINKLVATHDHIRFAINPFNKESVMVMTIDHFLAKKHSIAKVTMSQFFYLSDRTFHSLVLAFFRQLVQFRVVKKIIQIGLYFGSIEYSFPVFFSSNLFLKNGVVTRHVLLSQLLHESYNDPNCFNMSLAIAPEDWSRFDHHFNRLLSQFNSLGQVNYSSRFLGKSEKVLLATNFQKDVLVIDIQVSKKKSASLEFLKQLEKVATKDFKARIHWGKVFFAEYEAIKNLWPQKNFILFQRIKKKYDPYEIFSNPYSKRVLNI